MGAAGGLTLSVKDRGLAPTYQRKEPSGLPAALGCSRSNERAGSARNLASPRVSVVVAQGIPRRTAENFRALRAEVADVRRDVEELKSRADNSAGYSKEIDHALARIAAIEKHLGIENKIAA